MKLSLFMCTSRVRGNREERIFRPMTIRGGPRRITFHLASVRVETWSCTANCSGVQ
jgi:hypothetical protein